MNSIDKKRLEELRLKHKDVLEDKSIIEIFQLKRRGDEGTLAYNPVNYPVIDDKSYSEKAKRTLHYLSRSLN
ncbi:MAG TPA: hypothetical protein PK357_02190 [Candidatus Pacearchaeota archaeon]|nr:hypothetical protein [Candidatus Pacearchaeota archaeon]